MGGGGKEVASQGGRLHLRLGDCISGRLSGKGHLFKEQALFV